MQALQTPGMRQTWTTALTHNAKAIGVEKRVHALFPNAINIAIENVAIPILDTQDQTHQWVGMDQGRVVSVNDKPLYSTQFGSCVAILARAFPAHSTNVSHMSLNHIYLKPANFRKTLEELVETIQRTGAVEIFISGGNRSSIEDLEEIQAIVSDCTSRFKNVEFRSKASTFGIAEVGEYYLFDENRTGHQGNCGLASAGFDQQGNPCQVIDVTHPSFKNSLPKNPNVRWFKSSP